VKNAATGFVGQTSDNERASQAMKRIALVNNYWQVSRTFFGMVGGASAVLEDLLIDHNTAGPCGYSAYYYAAHTGPALIRFRLTNNVMGFGAYGVQFPKPGEGLAKLAPGAMIARNTLVNVTDTGDGQGGDRNRPNYVDQAMYTSFASLAAAGLNANGTLAATSPNRRAGTDGKDIGADFDELQRALAGQASPN
jgi:hypothetical protein